MKITRLETLFVRPRWCFLKVHTDEGLVGLGEPIVEDHARMVAAAVHEISHHLVGEDPRRIEHLWQSVYRWGFYRGGPVLCSALSGIEQALWDITGKWLGQPVYQLLGGPTRDRVRMYGWVSGETYGDYIENGKVSTDAGFTALKWGLPGFVNIIDTPTRTDEIVRCFAAIREQVGRTVDIGIDMHGRTSPAMAIRLARALEPYDPMFIEEPVLPENVDALAMVARSTSIPVATGERLYTKWGFREVVEKQAAAILQPDVSHAGGILECKKIAALGEAYYTALAPHCPLGPVALAACLQLDACVPNFLVQEHVTLGEGYLKQPFEVIDGYIPLPTGPGLGIELDEEALADKLADGAPLTGQARHVDGSVADY